MTVAVGDRVRIRDRVWRVARLTTLPQSQVVLEIEPIGRGDGERLSIVTPPEHVERLPSEELQFDPRGLDSFLPWSTNLRLLAATLTRETGIVTGARFGRVALEAYQLAPVLRLLAKPRPRLLIADDVGLGKTIEAGLAMLELLGRQRVQRILIVAPPGLLLQWSEELLEKFGLQFTLIENASGLAREQSRLPAGANPWDMLSRVITSLDFIKKETIRRRALRKRWDLVIVDEAHSLAESGTPQNPYRTQRTRLGAALRENTRGLILLTATPHNGYPHSFRSLIELVEPTAATLTGATDTIHRRVATAMVRRLKPQIRRPTADGGWADVFPKRHVEGISVPVDEAGRELLRKVASYCSRTARAAEGTDEVDLITFVMQIVKKRALSSRAALRRTLEHRLDALKKESSREEPPSPSEIRDLQADLPLGDAALERTSKKLLRSAIPADEKRRRSETRALGAIQKLLRQMPDTDPKVEALLDEVRRIIAAGEKVIVFTEYLDTLTSVEEAFKRDEALRGCWVVLRGGMSGRRRRKVQDEFESDRVSVLLATDAASEGLNLQRACRRIIHFELPWNPNRLEQRNGRVDRYGQTREPKIRYLFYPDSPEEDVLHRLIEKIERMQGDRVSTPDILGVVSGLSEIGKGLTELDPEATDVEARKQTLVRLFEDRTDAFVRDLKPLLLSDAGTGKEIEHLAQLLNASEPLLPDDIELERLVAELLGANALQPTGEDGVFRIAVPYHFRGPGVESVYRRATFRRSVAVRFHAVNMEYVTPLHPLIRGAAAEARRRFVQVYPDARGLPARRLAARRVPAAEPLSVLFAFLGSVRGGSGLLEERLILVRLSRDGEMLGGKAQLEAFLAVASAAGEVSFEELAREFGGGRFEALARKAAEQAARELEHRVDELRRRRTEQGAVLRKDLDVDRHDRECEIDDEERRARGEIERTGQARFTFEVKTRTGVEVGQARRAALEAFVAERKRDIEDFEQVAAGGTPTVLGALFLVPEGWTAP